MGMWDVVDLLMIFVLIIHALLGLFVDDRGGVNHRQLQKVVKDLIKGVLLAKCLIRACLYRLFVFVAHEPVVHLGTNDLELSIQVIGWLLVGVSDLS